MMRILLVLAMLLLAYGCSSDDSDTREETIGKEIADDYNAAMDKAQDVEDLMQEQKEKMDEALKEDQDP